jgi:hypothetical protein
MARRYAIGIFMAASLIAAAAAQAPHACANPDSGAPREIFRLRIVNDREGLVAVSQDGGASWQSLGRVLRYTEQVNPRGYTASKWVPPGRVAATAVNAIHISAGRNREEDRGVVFSLLPRQFLAPPPSYQSFLSPDSSIYTDIPAGERIFGGGAAPLVGSRVYLETDHGGLAPWPEDRAPARGDVLVIVVDRPPRYPIDAVFENWDGGRVMLGYADGSRELVGWVVRPVRGVGRFAGSLYAAIGRIRANHAGVIDVSTSPLGELGAFQIIPVGHAISPEMDVAWRLTQWMVVGPAPGGSGLWERLAPLFYGHIRPDYVERDLRAPDWRQRLLARFLVEVDSGAGWRPVPALRLASDPAAPLPHWAHQALRGAQRVRIFFPRADRVDLGAAGAP